MKMKTKKIVAKRFKVTAKGKLVHRVQGARHIRRHKNKRRQRRQDKPVALTSYKTTKKLKTYLHA